VTTPLPGKTPPDPQQPDAQEVLEEALYEASQATPETLAEVLREAEEGQIAGAAGHPPRPGWLIFCPHRMVDSVAEVQAADLMAQGIRGVILDLDNTLVLWHQEEMTAEITAWLEELKAAGLKLCILSNSVLSSRSQRIAERIGCAFVRQAAKPSRQGFRKAMQAMETAPAVTAIVGDQMFTDILGGNRSGIYTIMVKPMHKHEFPYTRFVSRPPEKLLLGWFKRKGLL
jgi:HAD superfamily phosphatase (TIGR01668 family)